MYLHIIPVILNEADSSTTTDLDVTASYSHSESNNQSDGNSGSSFVLFGDESDSETSSVKSGPLFRQDFITSESETDTVQSYENPENNIQHHVINKNKSNMDMTEKSHGNHQFWHNMKLPLEKVFNFQLIFLTFVSCTLFKQSHLKYN